MSTACDLRRRLSMGALFGALALAWAVMPSHARADEPPPEETPVDGEAPAEPAEGGDAPAEAEPAPEPSPESAERNEARNRVAIGRQLFEAGNYEGALAELERARDILAGQAPWEQQISFYMAQCHERLYRYADALREYQFFLDNDGETYGSPEQVAEARGKLELLRGLLARIGITVEGDDGVAIESFSVLVDGREEPLTDGALLVGGGSHTIQVQAEGYEPDQRTLTIAATQSEDLEFVLRPLAEDYEGLEPALFSTMVGVAGASLFAAGGLGLGARLARNSVDTATNNPDIVEALEGAGPDEERKIRRLSIASDAMLGTAVLVGVNVSVVPMVGTDRAGVGVVGSF